MRKNRNIYSGPETKEISCGTGLILVEKITKWEASVYCYTLSSLESKMVADGITLDGYFIVLVSVYPQTNCRKCSWIRTGPQRDGQVSKWDGNQQKIRVNREASLEPSSQKIGRKGQKKLEKISTKSYHIRLILGIR